MTMVIASASIVVTAVRVKTSGMRGRDRWERERQGRADEARDRNGAMLHGRVSLCDCAHSVTFNFACAHPDVRVVAYGLPVLCDFPPVQVTVASHNLGGKRRRGKNRHRSGDESGHKCPHTSLPSCRCPARPNVALSGAREGACIPEPLLAYQPR